ncbi:hypothetical protein [Streptomyces sp. S186]|uniref:hypothetical protein n=1 Tax=Streptomyces sp. S186 TaxID=3434395 RepID=UPI003F679B7D
MADTEGAADGQAASEAPVTKPSPGDRRKRITDRALPEGRVTIEELVGRQAMYEAVSPASPAGFGLVVCDERLPREEQEALQSL